MNNTLFFGLGIGSACVTILIVALVVLVFRLYRKVGSMGEELQQSGRVAFDLSNRVSTEVDRLGRGINEVSDRLERIVTDVQRDTVDAANKYTDSRIDKELNKMGKTAQ